MSEISEISEIMPLVNALLKRGQRPSADQIRRMLIVIDKQDAEIERLRGIVKAQRHGIVKAQREMLETLGVSINQQQTKEEK